jgi:hypothetical protein
MDPSLFPDKKESIIFHPKNHRILKKLKSISVKFLEIKIKIVSHTNRFSEISWNIQCGAHFNQFLC